MEIIISIFRIPGIIFICHLILIQKKEVSALWAWILLLFFLPPVGVVLYLLTGQEIGTRKKEREEGGITTEENKVEIFSGGEEKFTSLLEDIKAAEKEILLQYYIIQKDELLEIVEESLLEKAGKGVKIKILYDSLGSRTMKRKDWRKMKEGGIRIRRFRPRKKVPLFFYLNHRNHRKIVVIDQRISYMGGINMGKEYLGLDPRFGPWRDTHLRIEGEASGALRRVFFRDWGESPGEDDSRQWNMEERIPEKKKREERVTGTAMVEAGSVVQIITSGPFSKASHIRNTYLRLIAGAREKIWIQTPYFIPDTSVFTALKLALLASKEVKLMIPCIPDHLFVYDATLSYARELAELGARIYIYEGGFLHAKGIIIDELVCCYGSANVDIRSFHLNYEINAILYDKKTVDELCEIYREDITKCRILKENEKETEKGKIRIKEQLCRLLSPLL